MGRGQRRRVDKKAEAVTTVAKPVPRQIGVEAFGAAQRYGKAIDQQFDDKPLFEIVLVENMSDNLAAGQMIGQKRKTEAQRLFFRLR